MAAKSCSRKSISISMYIQQCHCHTVLTHMGLTRKIIRCLEINHCHSHIQGSSPKEFDFFYLHAFHQLRGLCTQVCSRITSCTQGTLHRLIFTPSTPCLLVSLSVFSLPPPHTALRPQYALTEKGQWLEIEFCTKQDDKTVRRIHSPQFIGAVL